MTKFFPRFASAKITVLLAGAALALPAFVSAISFELRSAAFFPINDRVQKIYGHAWPDYQIEVALPLCSCVDLFANGEYFNKKGHLHENCHGHSRLEAINFSTGLTGHHCFCSCWQVYAGLGVLLGEINLKDHTRCHGSSSQDKFAVGGVLKTGIHYFISQNIFVDLFADYQYQPVRFHHRTVDVGGVKIGVGLGVRL